MQFFNRIFMKNFQNFLKCSQFAFFVQTRKKVTNGLLNFFEKYAKIMHFLQYSYENFLKTFQQIVFFVQTREKQTHDLLKVFKTC